MRIPTPIWLLLALTIFIRAKTHTLDNPKHYCGSEVQKVLSAFCEVYYEPADDIPSKTENGDGLTITEECCKKPCSLKHMLSMYCQKVDSEAIELIFGNRDSSPIKDFRQLETKGTIYLDTKGIYSQLRKHNQNARKKNAKRNMQKRHKRRSRCASQNKRNEIQNEEKRNRLLARRVPEHIIGWVDYHENEPIIVTDSL